MKLSIRHETHYEYSAPLQYALQQLCLTPQANAHQSVEHWQVSAPGHLYAQRDAYGNLSHSWSMARARGGRHVYRGSVTAQGVVRTLPSAWLVDDLAAPHPALYLRPTALTLPVPAIADLARRQLAAQTAGEAALLALAGAVAEAVAWRGGVTHVGTTAAEALALGAGVCQDQAHVFIAACRAAGLPARYVSGYFHSPQARHLASHAWADVCIDVAQRRWLSVDVTHRCTMDERHVRLAVGPDYAACAPVRGVREGGGDETLRVRVLIDPVGGRAHDKITLEP